MPCRGAPQGAAPGVGCWEKSSTPSTGTGRPVPAESCGRPVQRAAGGAIDRYHGVGVLPAAVAQQQNGLATLPAVKLLAQSAFGILQGPAFRRQKAYPPCARQRCSTAPARRPALRPSGLPGCPQQTATAVPVSCPVRRAHRWCAPGRCPDRAPQQGLRFPLPAAALRQAAPAQRNQHRKPLCCCPARRCRERGGRGRPSTAPHPARLKASASSAAKVFMAFMSAPLFYAHGSADAGMRMPVIRYCSHKNHCPSPLRRSLMGRGLSAPPQGMNSLQ